MDLLMILIIEKLYYEIHMNFRYHDGTFFSGFLIPTVLVLLALSMGNKKMNSLSRYRITVRAEWLCAGIATILSMVYQIITPFRDESSFLGEEIAHFLTSGMVLGVILVSGLYLKIKAIIQR